MILAILLFLSCFAYGIPLREQSFRIRTRRTAILAGSDDRVVRVLQEEQRKQGDLLFSIYNEKDLYGLFRDSFYYEIRMENTQISPGTQRLTTAKADFEISVSEFRKNETASEETLSRLSRFSSKRLESGFPVVVLTTGARCTTSVLYETGSTKVTCHFQGAKPGEIITLTIPDPMLAEALSLGSRSVEIRYTGTRQ